MPKKPRQTKQQRERDEETAACEAFAAELSWLVGCDIHVEPICGYAYRQGGAISLNTMNEIVARLIRKDEQRA